MKLLLTLVFSFFSVALLAQSADCYDQWYALFKERGANPVKNGTHEVIISLQHDTYSECFMGKIDVSGGKITGKLLIQKMNDSYEEFDQKLSASYMNPQGVLKESLRDVTNGMTEALTLTSGETVRLFFYKALAEKPKANKKAPAPSELIKN